MIRCVIVGEAWGEQEERQRKPFVGASGRFLHVMLSQAGIPKHEVFLTNCFNLRPPSGNNVANLCGPKEEGIKGRKSLSSGKYVRAEYAPELERLEGEIKRLQPNLVIALGGTATWALLDEPGIKKIRGAVTFSQRVGCKVLPTYHPAAVLRSPGLRPVLVADLLKAKDEMESPEIDRPNRRIFIEPTLEDLVAFERDYMDDVQSVDIETKQGIITCVGFAPTKSIALVVPFYDPMRPDGAYWRTPEQEFLAWRWVERQCKRAVRVRVGQNFMYDMNYMRRTVGIDCPNTDDTMLLHHALHPEMEKGLGFLATIYTKEASWKFMRKSETLKKED